MMTFMTNIDLDIVRRFVATNQGLAAVSVVRADGTPHLSLVNAGILDHPLTGRPLAALVTASRLKLKNLRARPAASILWSDGASWVGVEGPTEIVGPDDTINGITSEGLRRLLRDIFTAAGGTHPDWDEYDRTVREERRAAVLVVPERIHGLV